MQVDITFNMMVSIMFLCAGFIMGAMTRIIPKFIVKMRAGVAGLQLVKCIFLTTGYKVMIRVLPVQIVGSKKAIFFRKGMYIVLDDSCFYSSATPTLIFREGDPIPVVSRGGRDVKVSSTEVKSAVRSKVVQELNAASQSKQIIQAMFFSLIAMALSAVAVMLIYITMTRVNMVANMVIDMATVPGV